MACRIGIVAICAHTDSNGSRSQLSALSRPILLHLTQPPLDQRIDQHWQLRIRTSQGDGLWQAQLLAVHHYHWAMSFDFMIKEPYQRSMSLTVFRDQVSLEQWRELNVLANVSAVTTN